MESPTKTTVGFPFGWDAKKISIIAIVGAMSDTDGTVVVADGRQRAFSASTVSGIRFPHSAFRRLPAVSHFRQRAESGMWIAETAAANRKEIMATRILLREAPARGVRPHFVLQVTHLAKPSCTTEPVKRFAGIS